MLDFIKKNYCMILTVIFIICIAICCLKARKEGFKLIELVTPPLEKIKTEEHGYGCRINGYRCEPIMIYKIELQGKGIFNYMKYLKYKMIDNENIVRYTGLYRGLEGVPVGSYLTFDNGQEYVITTLDTISPTKDCPTVRRKLCN